MSQLSADSHPAQPLTIIDDAALTASAFAGWRQALLENAIREYALWRLPDDSFVFRNQEDSRGSYLGPRVALGFDPRGEDWTVQINEAAEPGDINVLSAIARDENGRTFLLRQGRLNSNRQVSETIYNEEFARLTGLAPVQVVNGQSLKGAKRDWYVVTALDLDRQMIIQNTGMFVRQCSIARTGGIGVGDPAELEVLADLYGPDETPGSFMTSEAEGKGPQRREKRQGEVWYRMASLIRKHGGIVHVPRHAAGYSVDAEIVVDGRNILVEIKTSLDPVALYAGLGQLSIYRKLLPRLAEHVPILLVPHRPPSVLEAAIEACGVRLCTYIQAKNGEMEFSPAFYTLCGLKTSESW